MAISTAIITPGKKHVLNATISKKERIPKLTILLQKEQSGITPEKEPTASTPEKEHHNKLSSINVILSIKGKSGKYPPYYKS